LLATDVKRFNTLIASKRLLFYEVDRAMLAAPRFGA